MEQIKNLVKVLYLQYFFVNIIGVTINNQQQCETSHVISSRKNDPLILQGEEKFS